MRGAWLFAFSCATLALTIGSADEPTCLIYSTATLEEAVNIVHSQLDKKYPGQKGRSYGEGIVREAPPENDEEEAEQTGIDALRALIEEQKDAQGRKKRSPNENEPFDVEFGDMVEMFNEREGNVEKKTESPPARNITCSQNINGKDVTVELPSYLVTLFDVKAFFDKLYR